MEQLKNKLKQRLQQRNLGNQTLGVLVLRGLQDMYPDVKFDAYVKFDKLFVQSADKGFQIELFKNKRNILDQIEEKLRDLGYTEKLREIIFKAGKFVEKKNSPASCGAVDFDNSDLCVDESEIL